MRGTVYTNLEANIMRLPMVSIDKNCRHLLTGDGMDG